ncbi:MAG: hypothetical protein ACOC1F_01660 [Myxococcota bacterium]
MTLLPHPSRPGEQALFCGLEDPGHIVYWEDLDATPNRVIDFEIIDGIEALGDPAYPGYRIGPYNGFVRARDPATIEDVSLIGLYFRSYGPYTRRHGPRKAGWFTTLEDSTRTLVRMRRRRGSYGGKSAAERVLRFARDDAWPARKP